MNELDGSPAGLCISRGLLRWSWGIYLKTRSKFNSIPPPCASHAASEGFANGGDGHGSRIGRGRRHHRLLGRQWYYNIILGDRVVFHHRESLVMYFSLFFLVPAGEIEIVAGAHGDRETILESDRR